MRTFISVLSCMLCIACILTPQQAIAQYDHERCGTMEYLEKQKKADPTLGAEIARLSTGQIQNPGTYSMQHDASRLIPGRFFVRITTGRTIETAKFAIQR